MKKRNLFITLGLALGLGVGVFAGLKAGQEVKEVKADYPAVWYITGNYSGGAWGTFQPFSYNSDTEHYEKVFYAEAGNQFKIFDQAKYDSYEMHRGMNGDYIDYNNKGWEDLTSWADGNNFNIRTTGTYVIYYSSVITGYEKPTYGFYIQDAVQYWIDNYMHMADYDKDGTVGSTGGNGSCTTYYSTAKDALLNLGEEAVTAFSTNSGSKYTTALARYNEWARINNDAAPFEDSGSGSRNVLNKTTESNNSSLIIVASISGAVLLTVGGYFVIRNRKED